MVEGRCVGKQCVGRFMYVPTCGLFIHYHDQVNFIRLMLLLIIVFGFYFWLQPVRKFKGERVQ